MNRKVIVTFTILIVLMFNFSFAQTNGNEKKKSNTELEQLKSELNKLKLDHESKLQEINKLITEIKSKIEKKEREDELENLLKEANQLSAQQRTEEVDISKRFHSGVRQQQKLNPNISVSGDFFGGISTSKENFVSKPNNFSYGNNGFFLREF